MEIHYVLITSHWNYTPTLHHFQPKASLTWKINAETGMKTQIILAKFTVYDTMIIGYTYERHYNKKKYNVFTK